jgi:hypothetical protein
MKGKYKAALALLLLMILLPLTLLMTLAQWVPTLAGVWLPVGHVSPLKPAPSDSSLDRYSGSPLSG